MPRPAAAKPPDAAPNLSAPQKAMHRLGLVRDTDLALHLPLRYEDETVVTPLRQARDGQTVQVEGEVRDNRIEQRGRRQDAWRYWTMAAQHGDTEAMRELIEGYDRLNLQQCWTWFYLAKLLGTDLSKDEYRAINEDGSDYDDDLGGPAYVSGRDGVVLEPIDGDQKAAAQRAATTLYQAIKANYEG